MKRLLVVLVAALVLFVLVGCAGQNTAAGVAVDGDIAGFWSGLWHGIIIPISWFFSLFFESVNVYEVHNNGNWYDFGFGIGVCITAYLVFG
ncbi:MAG TPA: hypothetical protein VM581_04365 [Magnetospirillaceae bacterium]|nr:hypothetical protein [Magnetospirillaceae bacterium]